MCTPGSVAVRHSSCVMSVSALQMPVIASNRCGVERFGARPEKTASEIKFHGGSFITGPTGDIVAQVPSEYSAISGDGPHNTHGAYNTSGLRSLWLLLTSKARILRHLILMQEISGLAAIFLSCYHIHSRGTNKCVESSPHADEICKILCVLNAGWQGGLRPIPRAEAGAEGRLCDC